MKVICVYGHYHINPITPKLTEGCVYEVVGNCTNNKMLFYVIKGYEGNYKYNFFYDARGFIPLSTIDERELFEQRQTELV